MGFRLKILTLLPLLLWAQLSFAGVEQISEKAFRELAVELSAKVNLFKAGWEQDPQAEFYGGTTRDYLYWLKGQFTNTHNAEQAAAVVANLRSQPIIDVRDFIIGDSDVDVISDSTASLKAENFVVRKIDFQSPEILNPKSELGKNEFLQGYIPAEKIRLARGGFHASPLGNGVQEIYQGKLSIHFASADDFAKSKYAQEGINHPILLAIRYLRLQAINYYRSHGQGFPDSAKLHAGMEEASAKAVKEVIAQAVNSNELAPYLKQNKFKSWINGGIQKSFRSYTNPTAALELMKEFGVDRLPERYPNEIETLNQYVFTKFRDPQAIKAAFEKYGIDPQTFYTPPAQFFPDGRIYHGTKTEAGFRGIVFQGIMPSDGGLAGKGLYGVADKNKSFSETWAGDKNRLLSFAMSPQAKVVDITQGQGAEAWKKIYASFPGDPHDAFADLFGIDVMRYPYNETEAFVVKNGGVLSDGQGVHRSIMSLGAMLEKAKKTTSIQEMLAMLSVNSVSTTEKEMVWQASPITLDQAIQYAKKFGDRLWSETARKEVIEVLNQPHWIGSEKMSAFLQSWISRDNSHEPEIAFQLFTQDLHPDSAHLALLDRLVTQENNVKGDPKREAIMLEYIRTHGKPQPLSTEVALKAYEKFSTTNRAHLEDTPWEPIHYAKYLSEADLTPEQLARLENVHKKLLQNGMEKYKSFFIPAMLRNGYKTKELRDGILADIAAWKSHPPLPNVKQKFDLAELLTTVKPFFPNDPGVKDAFFNFFTAGLKRYNSIVANSFSQTVALVRDDERTKAFLWEKVAHQETLESAQEGLMHLDLNDHEYARYLDSFEYASPRSQNIQKTLVARNMKVEPESALALVRAFIRMDGHRADTFPLGAIRSTIRAVKNPAPLQNYLADIAARPENIIFKDGKNPTFQTKMREIEGVANLINSESVPTSPAIEEKLLLYLDAHLDEITVKVDVYALVKRFDLSNPATAHRVMGLIKHNKLVYAKLEDIQNLFRRMPKDCPTHYGYLLPTN